ncbi:MAG: DUF6273 domain-containing protein [Oscillospiraceae bacterium]|jgi:hypothetical protein|nr:DUF6273 domain-containing protein [Oscillospiraceae bacterium]
MFRRLLSLFALIACLLSACGDSPSPSPSRSRSPSPSGSTASDTPPSPSADITELGVLDVYIIMPRAEGEKTLDVAKEQAKAIIDKVMVNPLSTVGISGTYTIFTDPAAAREYIDGMQSSRGPNASPPSGYSHVSGAVLNTEWRMLHYRSDDRSDDVKDTKKIIYVLGSGIFGTRMDEHSWNPAWKGSTTCYCGRNSQIWDAKTMKYTTNDLGPHPHYMGPREDYLYWWYNLYYVQFDLTMGLWYDCRELNCEVAYVKKLHEQGLTVYAIPIFIGLRQYHEWKLNQPGPVYYPNERIENDRFGMELKLATKYLSLITNGDPYSPAAPAGYKPNCEVTEDGTWEPVTEADSPPTDPENPPDPPGVSPSDPDRPPSDPDNPPSDPDRPPSDPDRPPSDPDNPPPSDPDNPPPEPPSDPDNPPSDPDRPPSDPDNPPSGGYLPPGGSGRPPVSPLPSEPGGQPQAGDLVSFGNVVWRVLDVQGGKALLISEEVLFSRAYHSAARSVTWAESDLRAYLNGDFFDGAFTYAEKERVIDTYCENAANQWRGTSGGEDTTDKVFLLSLEEVVKYFGDSGQLASRPTGASSIDDQYNNLRVARNSSGAAVSWWLRSPGAYSDYAAATDGGGRVNMSGYGARTSRGVRPALWVTLP